MVPYATLSDNRGDQFSVNPELVQFVRTVDGRDDECLIIFGKDQVLRVSGTLQHVTHVLRDA
jgi:hypothetical protein